MANKIKVEPTAFYSYVRSKSKTRDTVGPLVDNTGRVVDDVKEICEFLNVYFSSVFTVENVNDLLEFSEEAIDFLDESSPVDIIYLDFSKALDKVPHERLRIKLEAHGINGEVLS